MLSAELNERITRTGPGTPAGEMMRRYWQPAALVDELDSARPVVPVRLLGQDLVLFRDEQGRPGLVQRHCCHRGADLAFGRLEDGGLRCPFHGWLFDVEGRCLEQPAEPAGSNFHNKVRQPAWPCVERNGIVFAWPGPGAPPPLPDYDCFAAPEAYSFAFKGLIECNWLQALEVGIDPAHASFLHRFFEDEAEEGYGLQFRGQTQSVPVTKVLREHVCPELGVEATGYGLRIFAFRDLDAENTHVRVTNLAFPNAIVIPMSESMTITQWHVPIDDVTCYWYAIFTDFGTPVDRATMREQRLRTYTLPDYRSRLNRSNDWGFDAEQQKSFTYTGMGADINIHDHWAVESLGPVQDRTVEHLGSTDRAITAGRKLLMRAIEDVEEGRVPFAAPGNGNGAADAGEAGATGATGRPVTVDAIGPLAAKQEFWREVDRDRRARSPWAGAAGAANGNGATRDG